MRVHTADKPYKCSLCDKSFNKSSNLQRHERLVHSNRRLYKCNYCKTWFISSLGLKRHVYTHTGAKPYSCRHCSDCFTQLDQLKAHLLKLHNEGNWLMCDIFTCESRMLHASLPSSGRLSVCLSVCPVSYTHLTLPTNREV